MFQTKNTILGKAKLFILVFFSYYLLMINSLSENNSRTENYAVLIILDKVNSQSDIIEIEVGKEYKFKNLSINILLLRAEPSVLSVVEVPVANSM